MKTGKMAPPLRAFVVQEDTESTGGIVYARHAIVARRKGASEFNSGEFHGVTCRRAPWADAYAPGPCPKLVMIDNGWWFECRGCGRKIKDDPDSFFKDEVSHQDAVEIGSEIYCSPHCRQRDLAEHTRIEARKLRALQALRDQLWKLCPGVVLTNKDHAYVTRDDGRLTVRQVHIHFTFPGSIHGPGSFRFNRPGEEPVLYVPGGDLEAWNTWRASQRKAAA